MKHSSIIILLFFIAGCSDNQQPVEGRWYAQSQIDDGAVIFKTHCASCHGDAAQGLAKDWKRPLPDGTYPPPPLNGTAHTWHHPARGLIQTIQNGGVPLGGTMPPFKDKLTNEEISSVLAFIQNLWSDEIYSAWLERGGLK
jgi:mono/diheme cytochrome c family protein